MYRSQGSREERTLDRRTKELKFCFVYFPSKTPGLLSTILVTLFLVV